MIRQADFLADFVMFCKYLEFKKKEVIAIIILLTFKVLLVKSKICKIKKTRRKPV